MSGGRGADKTGYITSENGRLIPPAILRVRILHSQMAREKEKERQMVFSSPRISSHFLLPKIQHWKDADKKKKTITHLWSADTQFWFLTYSKSIFCGKQRFHSDTLFGHAVDTMNEICVNLKITRDIILQSFNFKADLILKTRFTWCGLILELNHEIKRTAWFSC